MQQQLLKNIHAKRGRGAGSYSCCIPKRVCKSGGVYAAATAVAYLEGYAVAVVAEYASKTG